MLILFCLTSTWSHVRNTTEDLLSLQQQSLFEKEIYPSWTTWSIMSSLKNNWNKWTLLQVTNMGIKCYIRLLSLQYQYQEFGNCTQQYIFWYFTFSVITKMQFHLWKIFWKLWCNTGISSIEWCSKTREELEKSFSFCTLILDNWNYVKKYWHTNKLYKNQKAVKHK